MKNWTLNLKRNKKYPNQGGSDNYNIPRLTITKNIISDINFIKPFLEFNYSL